MTWTTLPPPVSNTVIATAWGEIVAEDLNHLRGLIPDPVLGGRVLISSGSVAGVWQDPSSSPLVANIGDTMTGQLAVALDVGVSASSYFSGHLQLVSTGPSNYPQLGFHRSGIEGAAIYYGGGAFNFIRHTGVIDVIATRIPGRIVGWNAGAGVPAGHLVHTALIDRFPIGAGNLLAFGTIGGAYSHSHIADLTHAHGMSQHDHGMSHDHGNTDGPTNGMSVNGSGGSTAANMSHLHHVNNYNGTTNQGGPTTTNNGSGVVTMGPTDHTPPYCAITFIVEV